MTIVSIKTGSDEDVRRIELSDGSLFSFKICYLPDESAGGFADGGSFADGSEINAAEEEGFRFASACLRAEKAALRLIAHAEQTMFGLSRKLEKRGYDAACTRAVISRLCETGLLDDCRYARLWLESRINRQAASPRRLLAALQSRGIDRRDAEAAVQKTLDDETEQQLLERYVQKLKRTNKLKNDDDSGSAQRSLRYVLKGEGFSFSAIQCFFGE